MNTTQITIGRVSTRKGARQHLDINGRAHCGAGRGTIAAATRWVVDATVELTAVCRRCLKALRAALAERPATDADASGATYVLAPAEVAARRDADLAADLLAFHATRTAAAEVAARPAIPSWQYRAQLLADLAGDPLPAGFTAADLAA